MRAGTFVHESAVYVVLAMVLLSSCPPSTAQDHVTVPGVTVSVAPPPGFQLTDQFPGFQHLESGSSIMVNEIPGAFETFRVGMTEKQLASRGMSHRSTEVVRVGEHEGTLIAVSQKANGILFHKWIGVFGTDRTSVMIVTTYPATLADELAEPLKQAILSARWNPDADAGHFDGLTFRIMETPTLRIANRMSNLLMLTKGGSQGPVAPDDPLLVAGNSISQVQIDDIEAFAKNRIMQTVEVRNITNVTGKPVTIDGSPGYEITAEAKDEKSGTPLAMYQVVVVRGMTYYLVQGLVGASKAAEYMDDFREIANSLSFVD